MKEFGLFLEVHFYLKSKKGSLSNLKVVTGYGMDDGGLNSRQEKRIVLLATKSPSTWIITLVYNDFAKL
jgi:hypothetical protein